MSISRCLILSYITLLNINLTTWKLLILYFENSTFGVIISCSGPVGRKVRDGREMDSSFLDICDLIYTSFRFPVFIVSIFVFGSLYNSLYRPMLIR